MAEIRGIRYIIGPEETHAALPGIRPIYIFDISHSSRDDVSYIYARVQLPIMAGRVQSSFGAYIPECERKYI